MPNLSHRASIQPDTLTVRPLDLHEESHGVAQDSPAMMLNFRVIWIQQGKGQFSLDWNQFPISPNRLFFVRPGQEYRIMTTDHSTGVIMYFKESFLNMCDPEFDAVCHSLLLRLAAIGQGIAIADDLVPDVQSVFVQLLKESGGNHLFRTEVLKRYLKIFLIYLTRQLEDTRIVTKPARNADIVQRFFTLLEQHYKVKKMVVDYAEMLRYSPNYLNETVKKTTGKSAGRHIRQRIVLEAKRKATYSDFCMKEIAYNLGFCDLAHFSKFFKSEAGINFTEYRKVHYLPSMEPAS
jgi:AraC family transcriptional activator of pobA